MSLALKPTHAAVKNYYTALNQVGQLHFSNEAQVSDAFAKLLTDCGRKLHLTFIPQFPIQRAKTRVIVDGALLDTFHLAHGYWEAKDEKDDLDREIKAKLDKGYPRDNIIFQAPERAVLYQAGARVADEDISKPDYLAQLVNHFFDYKAPHIEEWEQAVSEFSDRIPELATAVKRIIDEERRRNPAFVHSFEDFYALCRQAINPNLSEEAVERMLIQHLLTERIFERIFDNPDFTRRNVVAAEIEKVIVELTKRAFNRNEFLRPLDRFYKAIEVSAENTTGFSEKQAFLNKVYERFFQGYSPKEADTHGIVYTPQPIVNFMVRSVEEILQKEFGRSLGDKGVHILDPFVGTGNFIVRIMQEIKATDLQYKYENELHCNEVMLLPYYIASMNIEHAYFEKVGEYKAFPGICLVDTFELAEPDQGKFGFMTAENAERVKRQQKSPIFVIIGNPPYNMGQLNENDNNKNRKYPTLDKRVSDTYSAESTATNRMGLSDPYVKAIRWASDRIGKDGIVALVTNNSFLNSVMADGMRAHLAKDFDTIYVVDLGGNVRINPKISGTTHNVFGIQVGVSINLFVRRRETRAQTEISILHHATEEFWRKEEKFVFLDGAKTAGLISWTKLKPDEKNNWITKNLSTDYAGLIPLGDKGRKTGANQIEPVFGLYSNGNDSGRDDWVYNSDRAKLRANVKLFVETYNSELERWRRAGKPKEIDGFLTPDPKRIKWTRNAKRDLRLGRGVGFEEERIRAAIYRPFSKRFLYTGKIFNKEVAQFAKILPTSRSEIENRILCVAGIGNRQAFGAIAINAIAPLDIAFEKNQCFPFYTYAEDGTRRRENITDWALEQFRVRYHDPSITKWDIFHYIYAVLHHPEYRERYAANLRRELPRIPFVSATGAEARAEGVIDAGLKPGSSTVVPQASGSDTVAPQASGSDVEERRFSAASAGKKNSRASAPVVSDADLFHALAQAGKRLAEIHVDYEQQPEYKLTKVEKKGETLDYRVKKMKLSKDKATLIYNQFLTLSGIPKETYDYRLGNRSALEWVVDQYQVSTDKRSGIVNDPNREDDKEYILRLIGQVITVSIETVRLVKALPELHTSTLAS
jgi:predicted helicase